MRVIITDDSLIIREGLTRLLESLGHQVIAHIDRPERLLPTVAAYKPEIVLIDIKMPPTYTDEGLRAAAAVRRHHNTGILVLSQYIVPSYATTLIDLAPTGVGYLLKDRLLDAAALDDAMHRILAGETVVDPALVNTLLQSNPCASPLNTLTTRERQVLELVAQGFSDRGIAEQLVVTLNTVGTHIQRIFTKLGLPNTATDNRRVHAVLTWLQQPS